MSNTSDSNIPGVSFKIGSTALKSFSMSYPLNPRIFNQMFDEKAMLEYYKNNGVGFVGHNGIDFGAPHGAPIYACHDGTAYYNIDAKGGHGITLITDEAFDYNGEPTHFKTIYWHLVDPKVEPKYTSPIYGKTDGVKVKEGDIIGYIDSTGLSTGDHLHFGLKPVRKDEVNWIWYNVDQANGYMGAINPMPYFRNEFAGDVKIMGIQKTIIGLLEQLISKLRK